MHVDSHRVTLNNIFHYSERKDGGGNLMLPKVPRDPLQNTAQHLLCPISTLLLHTQQSGISGLRKISLGDRSVDQLQA